MCQAGLPVAPPQGAPPQDYPQTQDYFQEQLHNAHPTSDAAGGHDGLLNPQDNELGADSWSREPELGSWSPVFNHKDDSFASNQQFASDSAVPQIDESTWTNTSTFEPGVGFGGATHQTVPPSATFESGRQIEANPLAAEVPPSSMFEQGHVPELPRTESSQMQSFDDGSILAQMHSHDDDDDSIAPPFNNTSFANNQQAVSESSVPQTDESMWTVNSPSGFYPGSEFDSATQQEVPASLPQNQLFADYGKGEVDDSNAQLPPEGEEVHSSFYRETAVANSQPELFAGNMGHYSEDTNKTPQLFQPEVVPSLSGHDAVQEEAVMDKTGSVQADPFVVGSQQENDFPEEAPVSHLDFFDNVQPEASVESLPELFGNLQPGAFLTSPSMNDVMLPHNDLEPTLQEQSGEHLSSMAPQSVPPTFPQAFVQQDEPVQNMAENIPVNHYDQDNLPADEKPLVDSLEHKSLSIDSPSGTFRPNSVGEPMQPPSVGQVPLEDTPSGFFVPGSVEQLKLHDVEYNPSDEGQPQQESVPEATFQPSVQQKSLVEGKGNAL